MAGDWIKMRCDLQTHPKVVRMASALNADRLRIVGGLHAVWSLFDAHSSDGQIDGYTADAIDAILGFPGFAEAMRTVGWLVADGQLIVLPRFDEHNGRSAKRRANETERKRSERSTQAVRSLSASDADSLRTREEKRREEKKEQESTPVPAATLAKQRSLTFASWMESLAEGELAIPADHYVFEHAERAGLPYEFVELAWEWFRRKYANESKRYTDWRKVFANAVDGAWGGLWRARPAGGYELSPVGLQFQRRIATEAQGAAA